MKSGVWKKALAASADPHRAGEQMERLRESGEVAAAFLDRAISFGSIAETNAGVLDRFLARDAGSKIRDLEDVMAADAWARHAAAEQLESPRGVCA